MNRRQRQLIARALLLLATSVFGYCGGAPPVQLDAGAEIGAQPVRACDPDPTPLDCLTESGEAVRYIDGWTCATCSGVAGCWTSTLRLCVASCDACKVPR